MDTATQYLINDGYEILEDKVVKKYKIENIPEPREAAPNEIETLQAQVLDLQKALDIVLGRENI